jgi:tRNA G18 (ribose-2'-O)-methylase SpoU
VDAVIAALKSDEATLVLLERDNPHPDIEEIRRLCEDKDVKIEEGSRTDVWRMAIPAKEGEPEHPLALALVGRIPDLSLEEVFENGGVIWLLDGVQYATNMGFCIRTAEVSGADAMIISNKLSHSERSSVKGSSMRATRFIPIHYTDTDHALNLAKKNNVRVIVAEDVGTIPPWESDLTGDVLIIIGAERDGVSQEALDAADQIIRLPMNGFIPSYNLQVAISTLAIEAIRQRETNLL